MVRRHSLLVPDFNIHGRLAACAWHWSPPPHSPSMEHTAGACQDRAQGHHHHHGMDLWRCLTRAVFPRVQEFRVESRNPTTHQLVPTLFVIDRSDNWRRRVPRCVERELVREFVAPFAMEDASCDHVGVPPAAIAEALRRRLGLADRGCVDRQQYEVAAVVDFGARSDAQKSPLAKVVTAITSMLSAAASTSAVMLMPVGLHYCSAGSVLNVKRYAAVRYGLPAVLQERDVSVFKEDPTEHTLHIVARLMAALKMQPPKTVAQVELVNLSRSLHVHCAKAPSDAVFTRRQIASMNEEILQIHFRTRNHPAMQELKKHMQSYCRVLKRWRLQDGDVNSATFATLPPRPMVKAAYIVSHVLRECVMAPAQLTVSGVCDWVYCPPDRRIVAAASVVCGAAKCAIAVLYALTMVWVLLSYGRFLWVVCSLGLLAMTIRSYFEHEGAAIAQHWRKVQFYVMDQQLVTDLKRRRIELARQIHAIVAQYISAELPPPVVESKNRPARADGRDMSDHDQYALNVHHSLFINAPPALPSSSLSKIEDVSLCRSAHFAPRMLRNDSWRGFYDALVPEHLRFERLVLQRGAGIDDAVQLMMQVPAFQAVLSAFVLFDTNSTKHRCADLTLTSEADYGTFKTADELIQAALAMANEEESERD